MVLVRVPYAGVLRGKYPSAVTVKSMEMGDHRRMLMPRSDHSDCGIMSIAHDRIGERDHQNHWTDAPSQDMSSPLSSPAWSSIAFIAMAASLFFPSGRGDNTTAQGNLVGKMAMCQSVGKI